MIISRSLTVLAVLGLLLAPVMRPAIVMAATDMTHMAGMDMSGDMPCCQDEAPAQECTNECPFIALCMAGSVLNIPVSTRLLIPHEFESLEFPGNDAGFTSLEYDPPLRPPQS